MEKKAKIAVVLAGCGNQDGSEIRESSLTLWAIHRNGADYQCFAPDMPQHHVLNFINGQEMDEQRNVLVESARIARGNIRDLAEFNPDEFDAIIFPGGAGAIKNLSSYAFDGPACHVREDVVRAVKGMAARRKPIGALCIAPVLLARILGEVELTVGSCPKTGASLQQMGAVVKTTVSGQVCIDRRAKVVSAPCYMLDARDDQVGEEAEKVVAALLEMVDG